MEEALVIIPVGAACSTPAAGQAGVHPDRHIYGQDSAVSPAYTVVVVKMAHTGSEAYIVPNMFTALNITVIETKRSKKHGPMLDNQWRHYEEKRC